MLVSWPSLILSKSVFPRIAAVAKGEDPRTVISAEYYVQLNTAYSLRLYIETSVTLVVGGGATCKRVAKRKALEELPTSGGACGEGEKRVVKIPRRSKQCET